MENGFVYQGKERLKVHIETPTEHIVGFIHVAPGQRASEALNGGARFLPLTNVTVTPQGKASLESNHAPFVALNKDHIVAITECGPDDEY